MKSVCPNCGQEVEFLNANNLNECPLCGVIREKFNKHPIIADDLHKSQVNASSSIKHWLYFFLVCLLVGFSVYHFKTHKKGIDTPIPVSETKMIAAQEKVAAIEETHAIEKTQVRESVDDGESGPEKEEIEDKKSTPNRISEKEKCKDDICIITKEDGNRVTFSAKNESSYYVTVYFKLMTENLGYPSSRDIVVSVGADDSVVLADLKYQNSESEARWKWDYKIKYGRVGAVPDDTAYSLPYESGKKYWVCQSYGGSFSHNDQESYYAVDFVMPEGTPILVARDGVVAKIKETSDSGGPDRTFYDEANFVTIVHEDGTVGVYAHLKQYGVSVRVGEKVRKGEVLGHSGNTGFSTGPHLHFCVSVPDKSSYGSYSVPVKFETAYGIREKLVEKSYYEAL